MFSKTCIYSIRSILYVARYYCDINNKVGIKEIASELELPTPYLGKILQNLTKNNLIASAKGPKGGFYFTKELLETPIIKIVEHTDGLKMFQSCGLGLKECSDDHPCPLHFDIKPYRDNLAMTLSRKKVKDLITDMELGNSFVKNLTL